MLEPWNNAKLMPPPVHTCPNDRNFDLEDLQYICKEMSRILTKQAPLHKEAAIVSRCLYKFAKKFRNDIGFRNLKKVNTALRKYLSLSFSTDVVNFSSVLPSMDSDDSYLPTRQMLEYLLLRLQTFSKLMLRICVSSKQAAVFYLDRVKRGESHWMSFMPYAVMSRIWVMTSVLLNYACSWYTQLHKHLDKLQLKGMPFLPEKYALPPNLREWLDIQNLDDHGRFEWSRNKFVEVAAILGVDDESDGFDIIQYVNEINDPQDSVLNNEAILPKTELPVETFSVPRKSLTKLDQGQSVSRDSFKMLAESKKELQTVSDGFDIIQYVNEINDPQDSVLNNEAILPKTELPVETMPRKSLTKLDQGQSVSRDSFKMLAESKKELQTVSQPELLVAKEHSIENIRGNNTLKQFLSDEEEYRNNGLEQALTSHLSFMQWQCLKNKLLKLCNPLVKNRKIVMKFQKIWKERCLDYS